MTLREAVLQGYTHVALPEWNQTWRRVFMVTNGRLRFPAVEIRPAEEMPSVADIQRSDWRAEKREGSPWAKKI